VGSSAGSLHHPSESGLRLQ